MINILSYVGMNMQSEVCLWTLLGLMRTIFDATLFKVNANLKQVWQMSMPEELTMPVQRVLRTMISGIMLVQCFTVYVYLASYIVLLYPVFLEERPTLVLPWLLLAAIRKLLCELTSLAIGLGTCVLLGPARTPCVKFLVAKITSIMPAFYMWMLVYSYYNALKVAVAFKTFPVGLPTNGLDYGLELAVRRRCTKSLFGEDQLRKKIKAGLYAERPASININITLPANQDNKTSSRNASSSNLPNEEAPLDRDALRPSFVSKSTDIGAYEDWFGSELMVPRGDRILEQFVVMLLRIAAYLKKGGAELINSQIFNSVILGEKWITSGNIETLPTDVTDTPPLVGNSKAHTASYLREYPQIFMKKLSTETSQSDRKIDQIKDTESVTVKSRLSTLSSKSHKSNRMPSSMGKGIVSDTIIKLSVDNGPSREIRIEPKSNDDDLDRSILPEQELVISRNVNSLTSGNSVTAECRSLIELILDRISQLNQNYNEVSEDFGSLEIKQSSNSSDTFSVECSLPKIFERKQSRTSFTVASSKLEFAKIEKN